MKFILAEKQEMTQKFADDGSVIPVTKVWAGPCVITQLKTQDKDGHAAVQIGFGFSKKISKPLSGHLKKLGQFRYLREFSVTNEELPKLAVGSTITVKTFSPGDKVKVSGVSKGKGFQGVVKRWGFSGSPASHGHKDQLRKSGSIGAGGLQHVVKGKKMAGRMGGDQVTIANLEVVSVEPESNSIYIKGAVPGPRGNLLLIFGDGELAIETKAEVPLALVSEEKESGPITAETDVKTETVATAPEISGTKEINS